MVRIISSLKSALSIGAIVLDNRVLPKCLAALDFIPACIIPIIRKSTVKVDNNEKRTEKEEL